LAAVKFYLGTHMVNWLWSDDPAFNGTTFFVSYNRFIQRKTPFPRARHAHCRDSGGFTHLKKHGRWTIPAGQYVADNRRWDSELGPAEWIAPRDWMCEPWVIYGKNQHLDPSHRDYFHGTREARGLGPFDEEQDLDTAVAIHQRYTVDDYLELTSLAPDLPIIPVLQGWTLEQYQRCADMYAAAGVDLAAQPVVGLGSVCRRQASEEIEQIVRHFASQGLKLHGFGVKTKGLSAYADDLVSADSMAWSDVARKEKIRLSGHTHKNCANCPTYALAWRSRVLAAPSPELQLSLFA
jgi:hypothetical protein